MIALDANILLELIERRLRVTQVREAISQYEQNDEELAISTLSASHVFYVAEAHKIPLAGVERLVFAYRLYDVIPADAQWALVHYKGKDFEDALQIAAAKRAGASVFLTLDAPLAEKYQKFLPIRLVR